MDEGQCRGSAASRSNWCPTAPLDEMARQTGRMRAPSELASKNGRDGQGNEASPEPAEPDRVNGTGRNGRNASAPKGRWAKPRDNRRNVYRLLYPAYMPLLADKSTPEM